MGLDFTHIPDQEGVALYCLYNETVTQQREMEQLAASVAERAHCQTVLLSAQEPDGEKVRDFYDLDAANFPHVLLIRDDDTLAAAWSGREIPAADVIAYSATAGLGT